MKTKKFTILHSNDIHGDFEIEAQKTGNQITSIGGLSRLSGYVNQVRQEEENVIYVIAGDMVQGSLIDAEYKGISTMEIVNYLAPDVVSLGNHEFDYGLPQLLFLEKMANFPIVNANLYVKKYQKRMMNPYIILKKAGFDILFTGIVTEKIIDALKQDPLVGSFVSLEEASREVGRICNAYKNDDIDLTVLLTHIGIDSDIELAKLIKPEWGVDLIIGGHTHTFLKKPKKVNNILIAQAGCGSDQIGRFDIVVDDDTNSIVEYSWSLVPLNQDTAPIDQGLEDYINSYKTKVDQKYSVIVNKFISVLEHPAREIETPLGNLFADAFAEQSQADVMFVGSGSIRVKSLGPLVTLKDFLACFPYDDSLHRFQINGKQLHQIFSHIMRLQNRDGEGECYQINQGISAKYDDKKKKLISLTINGQKVSPTKLYTICMQGFHYHNAQAYLGISETELLATGQHKVVSTSAQDVILEYLKNHQNLNRQLEGRLIYV